MRLRVGNISRSIPSLSTNLGDLLLEMNLHPPQDPLDIELDPYC
ncbi:unnamed protein product [Brassica rapa subsp. narinosa]